ncbi:MAG TPA: imidazolonepropionase [Vicinamibacterales bacterium]|nr:imidazolonepropionase [Vicinamibacterales bacterium]
MIADFLVRGARLLTPQGPAPRAGAAQGHLLDIPDAVVAARDGRIVFAGPAAEAALVVRPAPGAVIVDAAGDTIVPGFVDAHTHVVYAGDRRVELRRRLAGASYTEIAAEGGGILATVRATRRADEEDLCRQAWPRLDQMLASGTTTCEAKSGYGLETAAELKILRAIRHLDHDHPIDLVPTFLGAHEVPPEYRDRRRAYIDLVIEEMIPAVVEEQAADWCDVFCDTGVFTAEEAEEILDAGRRAGLRPRIHADELDASGGALVAAAVNARSADHLIHVSPAGIAALAEAGVVATLLPAAAFYLKLPHYAPARALIQAGVPVALGTDINPGGGLSPSMPFALTLACFAMGLTLEEALTAATLNAAYAVDRHELVGSLEPGKAMDAVLVRGDATELLRVGAPAIRAVIKRGKIVVEASR